MTEQLTKINIASIQANPYQPRTQFDQKSLMDLAESIKNNGLIQPIIVRHSPITGYELIAGERRLRASQLAGLTEIEAIIRPITDTESRIQALVENIQRFDLNPIEEAKAIQNLLKQDGTTHDSIAKSIGKSRPYVTNSLRLLQLPESLQEALSHRQISPGHARLLLGLSTKEQEKWLTLIQTNQISVRQLENYLKKAKSTRNPTLSQKTLDIATQEEALKTKIGLSVRINYHEKKQSGQVTISFSNLEEFDQLIHSFKS